MDEYGVIEGTSMYKQLMGQEEDKRVMATFEVTSRRQIWLPEVSILAGQTFSQASQKRYFTLAPLYSDPFVTFLILFIPIAT